MAKNWNNGSNSDENLSNLKFESLSLGQKLLSKCLKKTGISVSVRGIAVNTTSQIKTAGSAWKSEAKYDSTVETKSGTLDDVSFPDLLGSSNRDTSVNQASERSSVNNENDRVPMDSRRDRYRPRNRYNSIQSTPSPGFNSSREGTFPNSSVKNSNFEEQDDLLGSDFLMPGMKGNYPLGFTNFIGRGVQSPPPPPPPLPYPATDRSIYQSYQKYTITRLKSTSSIQSNTGRPQYVKTPLKGSESPLASDSNWHDNKSDGYNEAELTTAIDSLNNSIQADRSGEEELTIKPFVSEKESEQYMDLANFQDNTLLLESTLSNQLDDRMVDHLEDRLSNQLETTLSNQMGNEIQETIITNPPAGLEKRKKTRYVRRKRNANNFNASMTSIVSESSALTIERDNTTNSISNTTTNNNSINTMSSSKLGNNVNANVNVSTGSSRSRRERKETNNESSTRTTKEDVGTIESTVGTGVHAVDETSTSSSLNSHNTEQSTVEVPLTSETQTTESKQEKSSPRSRRPRYRNRSKKKNTEEASKVNEEGFKPQNTNENEPLVNAVKNEKTHEKKNFKRYRRRNSQQNTSANSSNNNN